MRVAIVAALPGELKPLVKDWASVATGKSGTKKWVLRQADVEWVAVCAGMGAEAARRAFVEVELNGQIDLAISYGWVGALDASSATGSVVIPTIVMDAKTGERFALHEGERKSILITTVRVADAAEKKRLRETYPGAALVDMEGATIARLAEMRGIPMMCIKGVSDAAGAELPDLNPFINSSGQMRMGAFVAHVALRPGYWLTLIHLGKNSSRAAVAMRDLMLEFMGKRNVGELIRSGSVG
jgi:adenosylhomocysteine nucleosidase